MKHILNTVVLLAAVLSLISCSTGDTDDNNSETQQILLKATIDGQPIDYGMNSNLANVNFSNDVNSIIDVTLWDNKRLVIEAYDFLPEDEVGVMSPNTLLKLTIGETFLDDSLEPGRYNIGTLQDNLETNLLFYNSSDTNTDASTEYYLGIFACNVLSPNEVGEIRITNLDTQNKRVSGTFNGTLFRWIDIVTGELKSIDIEDGSFNLPYIDRNEEENPDKNIISARVDGYRLMTDDPGSPDARRTLNSGVDKIRIVGYDKNFGRVFMQLPADVASGNNYMFQPNGSLQSFGISFQNRINLPENLTFNNPNQSNDSYISISNHNPETNSIEGTFYIENSEIEGRTITDGYFKVTYIDDVD